MEYIFYEVPSWHTNYVFDRSLLVMVLILLSRQATGGTNMYFTVKSTYYEDFTPRGNGLLCKYHI